MDNPLTLQEAKDQVAKAHGLDNYLDANVWNRANGLADEAAELYAISKYKSGYKDGWSDGKQESKN